MPTRARRRAGRFLPNELVLVCAADDPLAGAERASPEQLAGRTWLLREPDSGTRSANEEFLGGGPV